MPRREVEHLQRRMPLPSSDLDPLLRQWEERKCCPVKTHEDWNYRVLVVGIRWWLALALVACPGAMAQGERFFEASFGDPDSKPKLLEAWIMNNTGQLAYDLHIEAHSKKENPPNIQGAVIRNNKFNKIEINQELKSFTVRLTGTTKDKEGNLTPTAINPGKSVWVSVAAFYKPKTPDGSFHYHWWWSDKDGNQLGPGGVVPEPETWAMLAGLGLAGFAVGRRVHAQRAGRSEHPKSS